MPRWTNVLKSQGKFQTPAGDDVKFGRGRGENLFTGTAGLNLLKK